MTALATYQLNKRFGGIAATQDVSLRIEAGARHALIGPNGAGKTTLINLLTGVLAPSGGRIELQGADITTLAPHQRVRRGLALPRSQRPGLRRPAGQRLRRLRGLGGRARRRLRGLRGLCLGVPRRRRLVRL